MEARIARIDSDAAQPRSDVAAIEADVRSLRDRVDDLGVRLDARIDAVSLRLDAKMDAFASLTEARFDALANSVATACSCLGAATAASSVRREGGIAMNARCFRLFQAVLAAALLAGTPDAQAQPAQDSAREVRAPGTNADAPAAETQREHGRRRNSKSEPTTTTPATAVVPFPTQPANTAADSKLICKYDQLSGTKVKRKVCGTAEQWAAWRRKNQDNVDELARKTREGASVVARPDQTQVQMPPGGGLSP